MSEPTPLTDIEREIQARLCSSRIRGYGGRPSYMQRIDASTLKYRFQEAHRGGSIYSPFGGFDADEQVEWAMRVLNYLTEQHITVPGHPTTPCGYDSKWADAKARIEALYAEQFEAARTELQEEYDADPKGFRGWNEDAILDGGKVTNPWATTFTDAADWFLANMTQYTVFTVWQVCFDAAEECVRENLGLWAEGGTDSNPQQEAADTFEASMRNLSEYIDACVKETATA
jgi:hypothetical protein